MTLRYGIDCGIPRLPMLPVSKDDPKIKALAEKINRLVAEIKSKKRLKHKKDCKELYLAVLWFYLSLI